MGPLSETQSRAGGHRNGATIVRSLSAAIGKSAVIAAGKGQASVLLPACGLSSLHPFRVPSARLERPSPFSPVADQASAPRWCCGAGVSVGKGQETPGRRAGCTHRTNSNQPLYSTPQPSYPGNGLCRFPDVVAGAVARGRSREDPAPGETRAHHRDVAAPGLAAGERKPEAVQGPRPRTSGPLTSGSEAGVQAPEAGLRGRGCKCPPAVESPGACDSGICFPAPEQPRRVGEGTKEKLRVAALPLTFRPRPDAIPECGDRESPRPSAAGSPADRQESDMAQESPKNSAAEIPVTSNGEVDDSHEHGYHRDLKRSLPSGLGLSETQITSHGFDSTKEGGIEAGASQGPSAPPLPSVLSPSRVAASQLAQPGGDLTVPAGGQRTHTKGGPVILADEIKNPAMEKLELVRKWSLNTYKCTRQIISEKLGRGSRTVDLELEAQIDILRDNKKKYENILKLAQTLATQLFQMVHTQKQLGDAFADLSLKSLELHEEFGYNADTQKLLAKNGETLLGAINFFIASVNTLVNKTIEDTLMTVKQYENARIEYDAYRTDLEELNLGPRDANTLPKIEQSQHLFQIHKEKYDKMRSDVSVKLKFLEENKVKVLRNQLVLFHSAVAAYFAGNQKQLELTLKQFHVKLKTPGVDAPSWLEEQ